MNNVTMGLLFRFRLPDLQKPEFRLDDLRWRHMLSRTYDWRQTRKEIIYKKLRIFKGRGLIRSKDFLNRELKNRNSINGRPLIEYPLRIIFPFYVNLWWLFWGARKGIKMKKNQIEKLPPFYRHRRKREVPFWKEPLL